MITLTEIDKKEGFEIITCRLCHEQDKNSFCQPTKAEMKLRQLCFNCNFWTNIINEDKEHPEIVVIVDKNHYQIAPEQTPKKWRGFGGHLWNIVFNDGRTVKTTNLWHQGDIPEYFQSQLPDNAKFSQT